MPREVNPKDTTRAKAYELWLNAPNPMVTFSKTLDVTSLIKISKKKNLKFNMLLDYCIGKSASRIKEFYLLTSEIENIFLNNFSKQFLYFIFFHF